MEVKENGRRKVQRVPDNNSTNCTEPDAVFYVYIFLFLSFIATTTITIAGKQYSFSRVFFLSFPFKLEGETTDTQLEVFFSINILSHFF